MLDTVPLYLTFMPSDVRRVERARVDIAVPFVGGVLVKLPKGRFKGRDDVVLLDHVALRVNMR